MHRLNLGCGRDIKPGWVNLDCTPLSGVDVTHDIEDIPLPFEDSTFDQILAKDILEHVDFIPVLRDLHRVLKVGGRLDIQVPHFSSPDNYIDPTHRNRFSVQTFDFFVRTMNQNRDYYFDFEFSDMVSRRISFNKRPVFFYNYAIEGIVNINYKSMKYFEATALSRLFPGSNIQLSLVR